VQGSASNVIDFQGVYAYVHSVEYFRKYRARKCQKTLDIEDECLRFLLTTTLFL